MSEKIVTLLVGSFIFMGFFNKKPVLAQPSPSQTQSQSSESQSFDLDEEEMMYMKLLEGNPKDVEVLKSVFHGKMKRGKTKEAIEYVERLIAIEPKEVEWRLLQALCYEMIGDYNKAKNLFKNILKERPLLLRALHVCLFIISFFCFRRLITLFDINWILICINYCSFSKILTWLLFPLNKVHLTARINLLGGWV